MRTRLEIWRSRADVAWMNRPYANNDNEYARLTHEYNQAVRMVLQLEACEHGDYEETLEGTIWHRVCLDCDKVTEIETADIPW